MFSPPKGQSQEVVFFLCCSGDDCARFTGELRALMLRNEVRSVEDPRKLVSEIEHLKANQGPVLIVLDGDMEHAWEGYDALKASPHKRVPVLAICAAEDTEAAYDRGVSAVLSRERWEKEFTDTVVHLTSFWVRLVRLPRVGAARPQA